MTRYKKICLIIIYLFILILLFFKFFGDEWKFHYLVPPGDDALYHMYQTYDVLQTKQISDPTFISIYYNELIYPPVLRILLATISLITGINVIVVTQYLMRFLMVLLIINFYFFWRRIFKSHLVIIGSMLIMMLLSPQPYSIYSDGTYLDLLAANFFLPWGLLFLAMYFKNKKFLPLAFIFLSAVTLSHHLTGIFTYLLLIVYLLLAFIFYFFKRIKKNTLYKIALINVLIFLFTIPLAWKFYFKEILNKFFNLFSYFLSTQNLESASNQLGFLPSNLIKPVTNNGYFVFLGTYLIIFGVVGLIYFIFSKKIAKEFKIIFILWILLLFIFSKTSLLQLPERFARNLYLPLGFLSGFSIYFIISLAKKRKLFSYLIYLCLIIFFSINIKNFLWQKVPYDTLVRFQNPDNYAVNWIQNNTNKNDIILGTNLTATRWGSFITLLTDRKVIPDNYCLDDYYPNKPCPGLIDVNSHEAKEFYKQKNISYIYVGKPFIGPRMWSNTVDYLPYLEQADYLSKVFDRKSKFGRVVILKVNREKI